MKKTFQTLMIGTTMAVGLSAIATTPAQAASLTNATIGGTNPSDYLVYDANDTNTFVVPNTLENVQKVLDGNATNPTGNVDLATSSEQPGFDFTKNTTLEGTINGKNLILSSLTADDWSSSFQGTTFGEYWFNQAISVNGFGNLLGTPIGDFLFTSFLNNGGYEEFSDPNISYVNQDDTSGLISIGLAGSLDVTNLLLGVVPDALKPLLDGALIQVSEVVKYTYEGQTDYLFSFQATDSGLTKEGDDQIQNGNYEVSIQGVAPTSVPEPSVILGMLGVAGIFATQRQLKKVSS